MDFSSYGIKKFNDSIKEKFTKMDIYEFIDQEQDSHTSWDIIHLGNVIEHVLNPEDLLKKIKNILCQNGILICTFPNDFSILQKRLLELGKIDDEFWISTPDHISYFNKNSFATIAKSIGLLPQLFLADFPIDFFLLNDHSNYIRDNIKGKEAHLSRVEIINLLCKIDIKACTEFLISIGMLGVGRNLTCFLNIDYNS